MKNYYKQLDSDKIKINWNKNPIKMENFLSFLNVDVKKETDFLGSSNGWTQRTGDNNLIICGGIINQNEYLDSLQYGKNLDNPYNNYVNPFYLFNILNDSGKSFFVDYYSDDINSILKDSQNKHKNAIAALDRAKKNMDMISCFWEEFGITPKQ